MLGTFYMNISRCCPVRKERVGSDIKKYFPIKWFLWHFIKSIADALRGLKLCAERPKPIIERFLRSFWNWMMTFFLVSCTAPYSEVSWIVLHRHVIHPKWNKMTLTSWSCFLGCFTNVFLYLRIQVLSRAAAMASWSHRIQCSPQGQSSNHTYATSFSIKEYWGGSFKEIELNRLS
jgi:hypothetical protein